MKKEIFPKANIGILHSKMTPTEKETTMQKFENRRDHDILVATSVIEVGVNVPNATVIIIEGAERFGLAQLPSAPRSRDSLHASIILFCSPRIIRRNDTRSNESILNAKNGFELAEYDLQLRGAGELAGGKQWGVSDIAMEALKNIKLVEAARTEAAQLIAKDPDLKNHPALF